MTLTHGSLLDHNFPLPVERPFTGTQAHAAGISRKQLTRLVKDGYVRPVVKGVFVAAQVPDSRQLRGRALSLIAPPGCVVCDWTATWYWTGVDLPGRHLDTEIDVFRFRGSERLRNGLARSGQRWFMEDDVITLEDGLFVTTPIRTAWDLGRFFPPVIALGGMDALLRHGTFSRDWLVAGVERFKRQRGVVLLRWLAPRTDPLSESPAESALRVRWHEAPGLPWPVCQVPILGANGQEVFRVDIADPDLLFAAEYDGEEWHGEGQKDSDLTRRDLLHDAYGWRTEVFRRANVYGQHHDASLRLAHAHREARRSYAGRTARIA